MAGSVHKPYDGPDAGARLQSIFEGASIGIARIDAQGHAYEANGPCQDMLGYTERELADLTFAELIHPDHLDEQLVLHAELMAGQRRHYELEKRYLRKDGSTFWAQTRTALVPSSDGGPPSAMAMIQDITARKLADLTLRANRDRLALIVETQRDIAMAGNDLDLILQLIAERSMELTGADGGMVSLIEGDELVVAAATGTAGRTVGSRRPTEESIAHHAFVDRAALLIERSEDDPRVNQALRARVGDHSLIAVPLFNGDAPVASLIVMRQSEEQRLGPEELQTLELVAVVLAAAVSRAAEFEAKRQQLETLARFQATYDSALVGMMMLDDHSAILDANPAMHRLLGAADGELTGRTIGDFLPDGERMDIRRRMTEMRVAGGGTLRFEHQMARADGAMVWVDASMSTVDNADSDASFHIVLMQDITQRKAIEEALREQSELNAYQALHDDLTDLPNRTLYRDRLGQALESARRHDHNVAVLLMDLNGFKTINDTLGHAAGDDVLEQVGERLKALTRGTDTCARLGGDEFAMLLIDVVVPEDVEAVISRLRAELTEPMIARGRPVQIDIPVGVALFPADGRSIDTLIHAADIAMYQAKRTGVSHVFHHDVPVTPLEVQPPRRVRRAA